MFSYHDLLRQVEMERLSSGSRLEQLKLLKGLLQVTSVLENEAYSEEIILVLGHMKEQVSELAYRLGLDLSSSEQETQAEQLEAIQPEAEESTAAGEEGPVETPQEIEEVTSVAEEGSRSTYPRRVVETREEPHMPPDQAIRPIAMGGLSTQQQIHQMMESFSGRKVPEEQLITVKVIAHPDGHLVVDIPEASLAEDGGSFILSKKASQHFIVFVFPNQAYIKNMS